MGKIKRNNQVPIEPIPERVYIKVDYFSNLVWLRSLSVEYSWEEAQAMYFRTLNKFKESKEQVIVAVRTLPNHYLHCAERLNF